MPRTNTFSISNAKNYSPAYAVNRALEEKFHDRAQINAWKEGPRDTRAAGCPNTLKENSSDSTVVAVPSTVIYIYNQ